MVTRVIATPEALACATHRANSGCNRLYEATTSRCFLVTCCLNFFHLQPHRYFSTRRICYSCSTVAIPNTCRFDISSLRPRERLASSTSCVCREPRTFTDSTFSLRVSSPEAISTAPDRPTQLYPANKGQCRTPRSHPRAPSRLPKRYVPSIPHGLSSANVHRLPPLNPLRSSQQQPPLRPSSTLTLPRSALFPPTLASKRSRPKPKPPGSSARRPRRLQPAPALRPILQRRRQSTRPARQTTGWPSSLMA